MDIVYHINAILITKLLNNKLKTKLIPLWVKNYWKLNWGKDLKGLNQDYSVSKLTKYEHQDNYL